MVVKKVDVFGLVFELEVVEGKKILRLGKVTERKQNLYRYIVHCPGFQERYSLRGIRKHLQAFFTQSNIFTHFWQNFCPQLFAENE